MVFDCQFKRISYVCIVLHTMRNLKHFISFEMTTRRFRNIFIQRFSCLIHAIHVFVIYYIYLSFGLLQNTVEIGLVNFVIFNSLLEFRIRSIQFRCSRKFISSMGFLDISGLANNTQNNNNKARVNFDVEWLSDFRKSV